MADIDDLIEASSFGTPEAKALRDSVSDEQVARVRARLAELTRCSDPTAVPYSDTALDRLAESSAATLARLNEEDD